MASSLDNEGQESRKQLLQLKGLTRMTGTLHDAQLSHLRMWGLVVFQLVPKEKMAVYVSTERKQVRYVLDGGKLYQKRGELNFNWLVQAIAKLDSAVHDLLGDEWQTIIEHNGKVEYLGPRIAEKEIVNERRKHRSARTNRKR